MRGEESPVGSVFVAETSWILSYNPGSFGSVRLNIACADFSMKSTAKALGSLLLLLCIRKHA